MGLPVEVNNLMLGSLGGYTVGRSLRFRSSASAYLSRTSVASPTNTLKWTISLWVKRGTLSVQRSIIGANVGAAYTSVSFLSGDTLRINYNNGTNAQLVTTQVFRDPSAWYHLVIVSDSANATASNRILLYVNGVQVTSFSTATYPSTTTAAEWNTGSSAQTLGTSATEYIDGYLAEVNFIDGQALTPSSFGAYDTNGVWQPKKYSGTYGTNGFYLPFTSGYNTTQSFSGSFNGSNQFLSLAANAAFAPSTGDFTMEANVNFNALPSSGLFYGIFENQIATTAASSDKCHFSLINNGGTMQLRLNQHNTANFAGVNWTPTLGVWYHLAVVRQSGTTLLFINGVQQTVTNSTIFNGTSFSQNGLSIGAASNTGSPAYLNGYISNARYVVGSAVYTSSFTPPSSNLSAITNTQLLTLQNATIIDNSASARTITNNNSVSVSGSYPFQYTLASFGADYSGNNNNWSLNNINTVFLSTTYDSMIDSPTNAAGTSTGIGNYAVLNPLIPANSGFTNTFSEANQNGTITGTGGSAIFSSITMSSGSWYWETYVVNVGAGTNIDIGICSTAYPPSTMSNANGAIGGKAGGYSIFNLSGASYKANNNVATAYGVTYTNGDTIMTAFDATNGKIWFGKNGTWMASGNPATAANPTFSSIPSDTYWAGFGCAGGVSRTVQAVMNFGQRPFSYTPPSGFKALNTYNLPAPSIANGAQYMAATTYTGNGTTTTISSLGFQPDLVWQKNRSSAANHILVDSVRGGSLYLIPNSTGSDVSAPSYMTFNSNGVSFTSSDITTNQSGQSYIAWQWKGGGTGVTNNSGTITSTVSANTTAGFSVVTYTGSGANATVGHGLGVAPQFYITKSRSSYTNSNWCVYHESIGATLYGILNSTSAFGSASTIWNNTAPTSSVFSIGSSLQTNNSGLGFVAYCFAAVRGYSAFGSYNGTGSTDGPMIYTGFRPRFVLLKKTSATGSWGIFDTSRDTYNVMGNLLNPDLSGAETSFAAIDFLSNGFKIRETAVGYNTSGASYIYAAFAEHPFNYSRAR